MHRITLLAIGSLKESWAKEAAVLYTERIGHVCNFIVRELPASRENDPAKQMQEESDRMAEDLKKIEGEIWLLDERGKEYASEHFARMIGDAADRGTSLTFVLGGAYGFTENFKKMMVKKLRLSTMTLPHELCRVLFLEQLYRAQEIRKGGGYHHG